MIKQKKKIQLKTNLPYSTEQNCCYSVVGIGEQASQLKITNKAIIPAEIIL